MPGVDWEGWAAWVEAAPEGVSPARGLKGDDIVCVIVERMVK